MILPSVRHFPYRTSFGCLVRLYSDRGDPAFSANVLMPVTHRAGGEHRLCWRWTPFVLRTYTLTVFCLDEAGFCRERRGFCRRRLDERRPVPAACGLLARPPGNNGWFFRSMRGCFSYSFNGRTEVIHETKTWPGCQLPVP